MRALLIYSLFFFFLVFTGKVKSTHIVGGEIQYVHVVGDVYEITLTVYRDCENGIPDFDQPAYIGVFDSLNNRIKNLALYINNIDTIPIEINDSCTELNSSVCYEVATYILQDTLPDSLGSRTLVYDRCCWNGSVTNLYDPIKAGLTTVSIMPGPSLAIQNSSPYFINRTPPFLCLNKALDFDHSAIDIDGDSLVYSLFTPFDISDEVSSHRPPDPPPYPILVYNPPYSLTNIMGGVPLAINSKTGKLTGVPGNIGQFVFGVKVEEYRSGVKIGEISRNYQFNVSPCKKVTNASFPNPIEKCGDSIVTFNNNSVGASSYRWHFGDPNTTDSSSDSYEPTHIYSGLGSYEVRLIAYSNKGPVCNDTTYGWVILHPELVGEFEWEEETCLNHMKFFDLTVPTTSSITDWYWRFGDGSSSIKQNPYHFYDLSEEPQTYLVTMVVTDGNNCVDSVTHSYTGVNRIYYIDDAGTNKSIVYPRDDSTELYVIAKNVGGYEWNPKRNLSDPYKSTTHASPPVTTKFTITVTDDRGCKAEEDILIEVHEYSCSESALYVPNAFSPNGDGENDFFRVRGEEIKFLEFNVFNRWGQQVFKSNDLNMFTDESLGWDGRFKGELQSPGVFVYYVKVMCNNDFEFTRKGNVTLLR